MQRNARLEDGPHAHGEWLAALVALDEPLAGGLALQAAQALRIGVAAMVANRPARPEAVFDISESRVFVLEVGGVENRGSYGQISYGSELTSWGSVCKCNIALAPGEQIAPLRERLLVF